MQRALWPSNHLEGIKEVSSEMCVPVRIHVQLPVVQVHVHNLTPLQGDDNLDAGMFKQNGANISSTDNQAKKKLLSLAERTIDSMEVRDWPFP